jgi:hypothetical protein
MKCPTCNKEDFTLRTFELTIKGNKYNTLAWVCESCESPFLDVNQAHNLHVLIKEVEQKYATRQTGKEKKEPKKITSEKKKGYHYR